ncbi:cupin domain-containing protein [Vibrio cholerae]|uniref:cupin domain-containing protein n=1 Tax=Vibrio cholerae TaxID=666 RepID=UPI0010FD89A3|nr:cupin domain-containing protein [Vibrio cholerae]TLE08717.1 cupin [Vibrio cholerae]TLE15511.1 cupin [Vibrio cholerae]TLE17327.1 cupin [Vibrio cholerae]TLE27946.1 cupin [Vibrio cholerae]
MLNMQMAERVVIDTASQPWLPSPMPGVWRKPLERAAAESGHATSLVRYDAGAGFPSHLHTGGEEIYVLEGVFSDETGDYPAGSYLRNPPGSRHQPYSEHGCIIFVKLHQFAANDTATVRIQSQQALWSPGHGRLHVLPLHAFGPEHTALVRWPAGERFVSHRHGNGEEILVISGTFQDEQGVYPAGTWLRNPAMSTHHPFVEEDTLILVKVGHLAAEQPGAVA